MAASVEVSPVSVNAMTTGHVTLIGAGPGDPGLLTRAGADALASADVVVFDHLVDRRLIDLAPSTAERIYVGKQGHPLATRHCTDQAEINSLLLQHARAGLRVARLKGGDPWLFARGAEEVAALEKAGIAYSIIPGVTAALAAAATAGIPLTHRALASGVAFITAHEDPAKTAQLDWPTLAAFPGTLVLYMSAGRLAGIAARLLDAGKPADTAVAIVSAATTARQRVDRLTLAAAAQPDRVLLPPPTLTIIGPVVDVFAQPSWFARRPLFGCSVLLARPTGASTERWIRTLEDLGAEVWHEPALAIEPIVPLAAGSDPEIQLDHYRWIVFTSASAVPPFWQWLRQQGRDSRSLAGCRIATVGPAAAAALELLGLVVDWYPKDYANAETLAQGLQTLLQPEEKVLWVRGEQAAPTLANRLREFNIACDGLTVYRQRVVPLPSPATRAALVDRRITTVVLTSVNIAQTVLDWLADAGITSSDRPRLIAGSEAIAEAIRRAGWPALAVPPTQGNEDSLTRVIEMLMQTSTRSNGDSLAS